MKSQTCWHEKCSHEQCQPTMARIKFLTSSKERKWYNAENDYNQLLIMLCPFGYCHNVWRVMFVSYTEWKPAQLLVLLSLLSVPGDSIFLATCHFQFIQKLHSPALLAFDSLPYFLASCKQTLCVKTYSALILLFWVDPKNSVHGNLDR